MRRPTRAMRRGFIPAPSVCVRRLRASVACSRRTWSGCVAWKALLCAATRPRKPSEAGTVHAMAPSSVSLPDPVAQAGCGSSIRLASAAEAPALSQLAIEAKAAWGYLRKQMRRWRAQLTHTKQSLRAAPTFVAQLDGCAIGYCQVRMDRRPPELDRSFVDPRHMRRGVGRRLLGHALDFVRARVGSSTSRLTPTRMRRHFTVPWVRAASARHAHPSRANRRACDLGCA